MNRCFVVLLMIFSFSLVGVNSFAEETPACCLKGGQEGATIAIKYSENSTKRIWSLKQDLSLKTKEYFTLTNKGKVETDLKIKMLEEIRSLRAQIAAVQNNPEDAPGSCDAGCQGACSTGAVSCSKENPQSGCSCNKS